MCIAIVCYPCCDVMDFEINLIFLIEPFFLHEQKDMKKNWISWERKELLRWNKKHFSSFLKGFQLSKLSQTLECALGWICIVTKKNKTKNALCLLLLKLVLSVRNFALQLVNWSLCLPFRFFQIISFVQPQDILCKPLFVAFLTLREKCLYSEFFWSVFSRIRTE